MNLWCVPLNPQFADLASFTVVPLLLQVLLISLSAIILLPSKSCSHQWFYLPCQTLRYLWITSHTSFITELALTTPCRNLTMLLSTGRCSWSSHHLLAPSLLDLKAVVVQSLSHIWLFMTPWTAARWAPLSSPSRTVLLRFVSIEWVMLSKGCTLAISSHRLCPFLPTFFSWWKAAIDSFSH